MKICYILILAISLTKILSGQAYYYENNERSNNKVKSSLITTLVKNSVNCQKLDSLIGSHYYNGYIQSSFKNEYTYNSSNNILQTINYKWSEYYGWQDYEKYDYEYNDNGSIKNYISSIWCNVCEKWNNSKKKFYGYDAKGNLTEEIAYQWYDNQTGWTPKTKISRSYDEENNVIQELKAVCYDNTWFDTYVYSYDYYPDSFLFTEKMHLPDGSGWMNLIKCKTIFKNGKTIDQIDYNWNNTKNNWVNSHYEKFDYDINNNYTLKENGSWDTINNKWKLLEKITYIYQDNKLQIQYDSNRYNNYLLFHKIEYKYAENEENITTYSYDTINLNWKNSVRTENHYDPDGTKTSELFYYWNDSVWDEEKKTVYSKDYSVDIDNIIHPYYYHTQLGDYDFEKYFDFQTFQKYYWYNDFDDFDLTETLTYYFSGVFVNIKNHNEVTGLIYPNPVKDNFNLRLSDFTYPVSLNIYDLNGKLICNKSLDKNESVSTSNLSKGIYVIKIMAGKKEFTQKLIVE